MTAKAYEAAVKELERDRRALHLGLLVSVLDYPDAVIYQGRGQAPLRIVDHFLAEADMPKGYIASLDYDEHINQPIGDLKESQYGTWHRMLQIGRRLVAPERQELAAEAGQWVVRLLRHPNVNDHTYADGLGAWLAEHGERTAVVEAIAGAEQEHDTTEIKMPQILVA